MNCENEIISLHLGNFANFIGTHYFNIQEAGFSYNKQFLPDINPNRLFRCSENLLTGELISYTPRAILVDDHFNQNKIIVPKSCDNLEDLDENTINFEIENIVNKDLLNKEINPFLADLKKNKVQSGSSNSNFLFKSHYDLENIEHWSEFMKVNLHKNSKISTNNELSNLSSYYHDGVYQTKLHTFWDQIEDSIRYFAEECHNFQGFQILTEGNTAYAGIANSVLSHLKDEYGKKCTILIPAYYIPESFTDMSIITSLYNTICGLGNAQEFSDLIIPISLNKNLFIDSNQYISRRFKNIIYKDFNKYEESAILATGLEFLTLPYRLRTKDSAINMSDYCQINILNRCLTAAGIQLPFPILKNQNFSKILENWNNVFFESISPFYNMEIENKYYDILYVFTKGITKRFSYDSLFKTNDKECMDILNAFLSTMYPIKYIKNFNSQDNLRLPSNFPNLFNNIYNLTNPERTEYGPISEFSGLGCLINSRAIETTLNRLYERCINNITKLQIYDDSVKFEYKNTLEKLLILASNYQDHYVL
uniref:Putative misato shows similarity with tubulin/ftsz family of gtp n=1 Tax=Triatoma infestans TaxID=30076 RepID=A0A023EYZ9_TRIIF